MNRDDANMVIAAVRLRQRTNRRLAFLIVLVFIAATVVVFQQGRAQHAVTCQLATNERRKMEALNRIQRQAERNYDLEREIGEVLNLPLGPRSEPLPEIVVPEVPASCGD